MACENAYKIGLDILLSDLSTFSHQRLKGPLALTHLEHQWKDQPVMDNHCPGWTQSSGMTAGGPASRG